METPKNSTETRFSPQQVADRFEYAKAFREQAESDFRIFTLLSGSRKAIDFGFSPEKCHLVHYLQMSLEKIAKAYRMRDQKVPMEKVLSRHVVIQKLMGALIASRHVQVASGLKAPVLKGLSSQFNQIAREIEKMAPAVDRQKNPVNAEYPWERAGKVVAPCKFDFPNLDLSNSGVWGHFLKIVALAIRDFDRISIG